MNVKIITDYFTPNSILDIGANTGWFYDLARKEFPDSRFYLVEANPTCEESLRSKGVEYHIGLLSDSIKVVKFYTTKEDPCTTGASIYKENTHFFSEESIVVNEYTTTTLDKLFPDKQFDLIKMDVQGSELDIIRGGLQLVSKAKGLLLEVSCIPYNEGAPLEDEVISYLQTLGFFEEEELGSTYLPTYEVFQRDVLFINKNL